MRTLTWAVMLAIGCGQPASPQRPQPAPIADAAVPTGNLEDDPARLAARALQLFTDWSRALGESTDCDSAAAKMNAIADANKDLIEANARLLRSPREKVLAVRTELDKREAEMGPLAKSISESALMTKCSSHAAFAKAVDRLAGEG